MSCPPAAGTITGGPALKVSITDRSATLPTAVPDVPLFCVHFMARHILCFHITHKFVLSLSHWQTRDSLNDVMQLQEPGPLPSNLCRLSLHAHARTHTHAAGGEIYVVSQSHKHAAVMHKVWETWATLTHFVGSRKQAFFFEAAEGRSNLYLWEFTSSPNTLL